MSNLITAVVPVRAGSQRVKSKSTRPFAGSTLLDVKLEALCRIKTIDDIIVSTDSEEAVSIANSYGVLVHTRDPYYASNECNNSEFFENMATYANHENILYAPCTAPLIKESTYYDFINRYALSDFKNLVTATLVKQHLWLEGKPLNYKVETSPNTQNLPDIMAINYGLSMISRELLLANKNVVSSKPNFYLLEGEEAIDIDMPLDFKFAEFAYKDTNGY